MQNVPTSREYTVLLKSKKSSILAPFKSFDEIRNNQKLIVMLIVTVKEVYG